MWRCIGRQARRGKREVPTRGRRDWLHIEELGWLLDLIDLHEWQGCLCVCMSGRYNQGNNTGRNSNNRIPQ